MDCHRPTLLIETMRAALFTFRNRIRTAMVGMKSDLGRVNPDAASKTRANAQTSFKIIVIAKCKMKALILNRNRGAGGLITLANPRMVLVCPLVRCLSNPSGSRLS
jgi:hypothetical protein